MKGSIALGAVPVLAALAGTVSGTPAYAAKPAPTADIRVAYDNPEITEDNSGITWRWTMTNAGGAEATAVVATHKVSADQKIVGVSRPCTNTSNAATCRFDEIKPGGQVAGWLRTAVAKPDGTLRVNAQVTWRETPVFRSGIAAPSAVDAGHPGGSANPPIAPGTGTPESGSHGESWGAAGSDASTDIPGQSG